MYYCCSLYMFFTVTVSGVDHFYLDMDLGVPFNKYIYYK